MKLKKPVAQVCTHLELELELIWGYITHVRHFPAASESQCTSILADNLALVPIVLAVPDAGPRVAQCRITISLELI